MTTSSPSPRGARARSSAIAIAALLAALGALLAPAGASSAEPAPPGFFGLTENLMSPADFDLMKAADATTFRTIFSLGGVKTKPGEPYDWSHVDSYVRDTAYRGIDLIPELYGSPPWISDDRNAVPLKGQAAAEWQQFVTAAVQRYGPGGDFWTDPDEIYTPYRPIVIWQVWNEPNSITWWAPRPDPKQYATLLQRSADAIHAVDPSARIMTAGIVAKPTNRFAITGPKYLKRLFATRAGREATDILAFHPFAPTVPGVRHQLIGARKALDRNGLNAVPIWVTEIGWGSKGPKKLELVKSEKGQVRALEATFQMAIREREKLGIEKLLWYHWRDDRDDLCRWCETSGLVTRKLVTKELYNTFKALAEPAP